MRNVLDSSLRIKETMREIRAEYNREGKRASLRAVRALTHIAESQIVFPKYGVESFTL